MSLALESEAVVQTLHRFDTEYSADSIEWCPVASYTAYFVCGTYQLLQGENDAAAGMSAEASSASQRTGRIYLFHFDRAAGELTELQRVQTAAILDMRWLPTAQSPVLAAATALGQVELYELSARRQLVRLSSLALNSEESNLLALSLDVQRSGQRLLCSDSKGSLSLLALASGGTALQLVHAWPQAHSFEAWICAFDKWDENRVYSGGDDSLLFAYDLRSNQRVLTNKTHQAGVTCLLSHPQRPHQLLTGSYDECVRVFDTRLMRQPVCELNVGGGVWRLKAHPNDNGLVLAACMYKNFTVLRLGAADGALERVAEYGEHESICYGADWCMDVEPDTAATTIFHFATCSFYDHKLCVALLQPRKSAQ